MSKKKIKKRKLKENNEEKVKINKNLQQIENVFIPYKHEFPKKREFKFR